jgi:Flp pilus assembly pilin Flp
LGLVIVMLVHSLRALHSEDRGQDLAEYCLLTALVALLGMGIFVYLSGGMQAVWGGANTSLTAGNAAVSASPAAGNTTVTTPSH